DAAGRTPAMVACELREEGIAVRLLQGKADLTLRDADGKSVLLHAVEAGLPKVVEHILRLRAEARAKAAARKHGPSAASSSSAATAAFSPATSPGTSRPAPLQQQHQQHQQHQQQPTLSRSNSRESLVSLASVNNALALPARDILEAASWRGITPLLAAIARAERETMGLLLKEGADITHVTRDGHCACVLAVQSGDLEITEQVLSEASYMVGNQDVEGWCSLHHAGAALRADLLGALLQKAETASLALQDDSGRTPLHVVLERIGDEQQT
ncbi:hypothetical protein HK405_001965, partial [Cladochytrium tenue]